MKYFLVGIKGSGMSALACILKDLGNDVSGSDITTDVFTQKKLDQNNIKYYDFDKSHITSQIDCLILANAFKMTHEQVIEAEKQNINVITYIEFIANLVSKYDTFAICGTNGKTTTTSLTSTLFKDEPIMCLIGDSTGSSVKSPKNFILESCEYRRNFLNYKPAYCVINNIEMDHPDYFKDEDDVIDTFLEFSNQSKFLIINNDDLNCQKVINKTKTEFLTFGLKDADIMFTNINENSNGYIVDLKIKDNIYKSINIPFYGEYMLYNTLSAISCAYIANLNIDDVLSRLVDFKGAKRRFETTILNEENNLVLVDDYAHHPSSIELTIKALRQKYPDYHLSVVFQPHTYSRVNEFKKGFAQSLSLADLIYLVPIFGSVRETKSNATLTDIKQYINEDLLIDNIADLSKIRNNHVIAMLGAGDIDTLYKKRISKIMED